PMQSRSGHDKPENHADGDYTENHREQGVPDPPQRGSQSSQPIGPSVHVLVHNVIHPVTSIRVLHGPPAEQIHSHSGPLIDELNRCGEDLSKPTSSYKQNHCHKPSQTE